MTTAGALGAGMIAVTLAYVGISKLVRPVAAGFALADFRVTRRPSIGLGRLLGLLEVSAAVLIIIWRNWIALLPGTLMLLAFAGVVARSLARGDSFECGCSASVKSSNISWMLVGRNLLLAAIGVLSLAIRSDSELSGETMLLATVVMAALLGVAHLRQTWLGAKASWIDAIEEASGPPAWTVAEEALL